MTDEAQQKYAELVEKIAIDSDALDEEVTSYTSYFFHVGLGHAEAVSLRDAAKEDVAVYEAKLSSELRALLAETGEKQTEGGIAATIASNPERLKLFNRYIMAKLAADRWSVLKDSFIHKGYMLREMIELYKLNYFGDRVFSAAERADAGNRVRERANVD